ncbi:integral membrane protein [Aspergillus bombycis]|uniref:Efficient mitochondria targeting-associated protein 19 n=1 Tax=Aspergillus bombycis TaxID=109264 RepID=A0A1F8AFZ5_9EURO|nr:integral membrane protein [Aspergillus bombycis]OGM50611.1 integral membrane protein [Aspergillus bombycis]
MVQSASLISRKRDLIYFIFFAIHLPIIFLVDTVPLLPSLLQTNLSHHIRSYYIATYHDKFFSEPAPAWFSTYIAMELVYHAPLSLWALGALLRDDPLVPMHLLVFGVQSFVTSSACLAEVWGWDDRTVAQKQDLTMLYAPYVMLGAFMALDMLFRLRGKLLGTKSKSE